MLPDKAEFVVCSIISLALSFWMKHLVTGQLQKPAKFSAFHWSTSRSQTFIGQLLEITKVVHLPKRTIMVLFTISVVVALLFYVHGKHLRSCRDHHIGCLITLSDRNGPILVLLSTDFDHTG